jgi:hypothetical protein
MSDQSKTATLDTEIPAATEPWRSLTTEHDAIGGVWIGAPGERTVSDETIGALLAQKARVVDRAVNEGRARGWCAELSMVLHRLYPEGPEPVGTVTDSEGRPVWRDAAGLDCRGVGPEGYNSEGFHVNTGLDREGYNRYGYDADGFNRDGVDADGWSRNGTDARGWTREQYDRLTGLAPDGRDRNGYDANGYDPDGYNLNGFDRGEEGTRRDRHGYDRDGYDRDGFNTRGFDIHGYNRAGINRYGERRRNN